MSTHTYDEDAHVLKKRTLTPFFDPVFSPDQKPRTLPRSTRATSQMSPARV